MLKMLQRSITSMLRGKTGCWCMCQGCQGYGNGQHCYNTGSNCYM